MVRPDELHIDFTVGITDLHAGTVTVIGMIEQTAVRGGRQGRKGRLGSVKNILDARYPDSMILDRMKPLRSIPPQSVIGYTLEV